MGYGSHKVVKNILLTRLIQIQDLPLASCMILGKLLNCSGSSFSNSENNGSNKVMYITGLMKKWHML